MNDGMKLYIKYVGKDVSEITVNHPQKNGTTYGEGISADNLGGGLYRLTSCPSHAWWLGLGDIVRCRPADEEKELTPHPVYVELVESAGHQTVSIYYQMKDSFETQEKTTLALKESRFTVFNEWGREVLVDITSDDELQRLMSFLDRRRKHIERVKVLGPPENKTH
jgi:hypothetical protein